MILALDTATAATTVALADFAGVELEARDDPAPGERPRHTTKLMPLIVEVLSEAKVGWEAVDKIAPGVGPGMFTGLRIGIATARALALARGIAITGVSTLESLAMGATISEEGQASGREVVIAAIDAKRGELFCAGWSTGTGHLHPVIEPTAQTPDALAVILGELDLRPLAIGEGAVKFKPTLERVGAVVPEQDSPLHRVTAINHCWLARDAAAGTPDDVHPEYLRLPDAEITRRRAVSR